MAKYKEMIVDEVYGWYFVNPTNIFEALKLAWYLFRYPDKVACLIYVKRDAFLKNLKPEN